MIIAACFVILVIMKCVVTVTQLGINWFI